MQWSASISCLESLHSTYFHIFKQALSMKGYHFSTIMLHFLCFYTLYKLWHHRFNRKLISLLRKKNTGKKTPREDCELGYLDFNLTVTFHLLHPKQKNMSLSPMHKKLEKQGGRWNNPELHNADELSTCRLVPFGRSRPPIYRDYKSSHIGSVELPEYLLTIGTQTPSHPLKLVQVQQFMHLGDRVQNPCEESVLHYN